MTTSAYTGPVQSDQLNELLFCQHPKWLVYLELPLPGEDEPKKFYFAPGQFSAGDPRLWLLYPSATAPPGTVPLCTIFGAKVGLGYIAENVPHYTTLRPGRQEPECYDVGYEITEAFVARGKVKVPPHVDLKWAQYRFKETYRLPDVFQ